MEECNVTDKKGSRRNGWYPIDGQQFASVSTVLEKTLFNNGLTKWRERTPNWREVVKNAQIRGTLFHLRMNCLYSEVPAELDHELPIQDWPDDIMEDLDARSLQWEKLGLKLHKPAMVEHTIIVNRKLGCAGTLDFRGKVEDWPSILDWKTSKRHDTKNEIQLGAYYAGSVAEGYRAERGFIPYVRPHEVELIEMEVGELEERGDQFFELLRRFYKDLDTQK